MKFPRKRDNKRWNKCIYSNKIFFENRIIYIYGFHVYKEMFFILYVWVLFRFLMDFKCSYHGFEKLVGNQSQLH